MDSGYTAYPHLRIAREHGLSYGMVLALGDLLADWIAGGPPLPIRIENCDPRYARHFEAFNGMSSADQLTIGFEIGQANKIFLEQRAGIRGMDGELIFKP